MMYFGSAREWRVGLLTVAVGLMLMGALVGEGCSYLIHRYDVTVTVNVDDAARGDDDGE